MISEEVGVRTGRIGGLVDGIGVIPGAFDASDLYSSRQFSGAGPTYISEKLEIQVSGRCSAPRMERACLGVANSSRNVALIGKMPISLCFVERTVDPTEPYPRSTTDRVILYLSLPQPVDVQ
jgi:hypothetical protein